jgi:hypothetical protein
MGELLGAHVADHPAYGDFGLRNLRMAITARKET